MRHAGFIVAIGFMIACKSRPPGGGRRAPSGATRPPGGGRAGGDFAAARARGECTSAGGATPSDGACPRDASLGTCTMCEGLMPDLHACATLVFTASDRMPDAAAAQAKCEKFKGTYTAP